jgi:hypothetical protein
MYLKIDEKKVKKASSYIYIEICISQTGKKKPDCEGTCAASSNQIAGDVVGVIVN